MISKEIEDFENQDFTMDSFRIAGNIKKEIGDRYFYEAISNRYDAFYHFEFISGRFNNAVYLKLKEALGFEDETINKIMSFIKYGGEIKDILVIDGNTLVVLLSRDYDEPREISYLSDQDSAHEMDKIGFNNMVKSDLRELITVSLNNILKAIFYKYLNGDDAIILEENNIYYNSPFLNIYFSKSLKDINKDNDIVKVLVKYGADEIYYFDMKFRNGYLVISDNEFPILRLSEILEQKKLVKTN